MFRSVSFFEIIFILSLAGFDVCWAQGAGRKPEVSRTRQLEIELQRQAVRDHEKIKALRVKDRASKLALEAEINRLSETATAVQPVQRSQPALQRMPASSTALTERTPAPLPISR